MPPEETTLGEEQMTTLAKSIADMMIKRQEDLAKDAADAKALKDAADAKAASESQPKPKDAPSKDNPAGFDMKELIEGVTTALKGQSKQDADKVYQTLFDDKLTNLTSSVPGLQEYLEGNDDFGKGRLDRLKSLDTYEERVSALDTLTNSYKQAVASNGGQAPTVSKKAQEAAKANEDKYKEIDKKWESGEYKSTREYTSDFFDLLSTEAASLTG